MKLITMAALEGKELGFKVTAEIQDSRLEEFEIMALEVLGNINLELKTDSDFVVAKKDAESCKAIAVRIHNDRKKALDSTESLSKLITISTRLEKKFDDVRKLLNKKVTSEDIRLRNEIVTAGIAELVKIIAGSPAKAHFEVNSSAVTEAIKNKRDPGKYQKMRDAVTEVVEDESEKLSTLEVLFKTNLEAINKSNEDFPGLYADKEVLALKPETEVSLTITGREEKFKNDKREADERKAKAAAEKKRLADERTAAKEKAHEEERIAEEKKAKADKLIDIRDAYKTEAPVNNDPPVGVIKMDAQTVKDNPHLFGAPTSTKKPFVKPAPPLADLPTDFTPTVVISVEIDEANASEISCKIMNIDGVIAIK